MKVNIFSEEWCDMVFEKKNKEYGAYALRRLENKRLLMAMIFASLLFILTFSFPLFIRAFAPVTEKEEHLEIVKIADVKLETFKLKEIKTFDKVISTDKLRKQIQFVNYKLVNRKTEDNIRTQESLLKSNETIGIKEVTNGTENPNVSVSADTIREHPVHPNLQRL